ncbi:MAG: S41 family peptidase [Chloroflexota bacterium]|jgi:carboxyl-terminal processing protease
MQRQIFRYTTLLLLILIIFSGGYLLGQSSIAPIQLVGAASDTPAEAQQSFRPFWETWDFIHEEYFDQPVDDEALVEGAIEGMLATLDDPNTIYLSPEHEQAARHALEGNLEGIGAEVTSENGQIIIVAPYEGSPAETAGLRQGDILRQADGVDLTGMDVADAAALIRGPAGTTVLLSIEREGEVFEVEVERDVINIPSVRGEIIEDSIAYVRLSRFANNTTDNLSDVLDELYDQDPQGLILDLRSNPGGTLTSAISVADEFLPEGPILVERFGNGNEKIFEAKDKGQAQDLPMVVLIDGGSASASEVVAGAIRDRDRGTLVGVTSFGKGTVQTWKELSNGGGVRITVARWITPDGSWVHDQGLEPDIIVSLPEQADGEFTDTQLQAAVNYLLEDLIIEEPPLNEG